jgi:hypothetical protein
MDRLDACIKTRKIATDTFETALREALNRSKPVSEVGLRDMWLDKLRQHTSIFPEGWYTPPPHGMFVQFAADTDTSRVNQKSNRPPEAWPRDDVFLDRKHGIVNAYASPVDRATGMIGDFGVTVYFGDNAEIQNLIRQTLEIDKQLCNMVKTGLEISALVISYSKLMKNLGMYNAANTMSDPDDINIGHSIPASDTGWSTSELEVLQGNDWQKAADTIANRRYFMGTKEPHRITSNEAFTIEPRQLADGRPDLPMIALHTIVIIKNGRKQHITGFDKIFRLAGMDYMFDITA